MICDDVVNIRYASNVVQGVRRNGPELRIMSDMNHNPDGRTGPNICIHNEKQKKKRKKKRRDKKRKEKKKKRRNSHYTEIF